jgi:hypothetical protein
MNDDVRWQDIDTTFTGASHLDEGYETFKKSPNTYSEGVEAFYGAEWNVMYSECPACGVEYKWTTSGLVPPYLKCPCGEKFKV